MISNVVLVAVALFLVLLLLLLTTGKELDERSGGDSRNDTKPPDALQSPELIFRIFSRQDRNFIFTLCSPHLLRIYREERRAVALHWVRRTSREVGRIMQAHRLGSRLSPNLNAAIEAKLLLQYLEVRFICGLLLFAIKLFGPHSLNDLAAYAGNLYQSIGRALPDAATSDRVASSEHPATF